MGMEFCAVLLGLALISVCLQGCGDGGSPTPSPTPPTPPPTTTHPTPPAPKHFCFDASCCKELAQHPEDGNICDDFYDVDTGIAYTMISADTWKGRGTGYHGMDRAIFNQEQPQTILNDGQQAMSLGHFQKAAWPYGGAASPYGLLLGIGPRSKFWRFFDTCKKGGLCAQCEDGFKCALVDRRVMANSTDMTYEEFKTAKNKIVQQTGTAECGLSNPHAYNEFDVNGLSSSDLAGVFLTKVGGAAHTPAPAPADVCGLMQRADKARTTPWPIYAYDTTSDASSLRLQSYLTCGEDNQPEVVI